LVFVLVSIARSVISNWGHKLEDEHWEKDLLVMGCLFQTKENEAENEGIHEVEPSWRILNFVVPD